MQYATKYLSALCGLFLWAGLSHAQLPPYAANLATPIGLEVDDQGWLWVAEVGSGNNDGAISVVTPDGQVHSFIEGLGSVTEPGGVAGSYHLELIDGFIYITNGLGTVTPDGYLLRIDPTGFTPGNGPLPVSAIDTVANTGVFASANGLMENNLYDIEPGPDGDLFLADAGSNSVYRMDGQTGEMEVFASLDPTPNPTQVGPPVIEAVPSNLLYDGEYLYVSTFSGFPFLEGAARIYQINMDGEVQLFQEGLTLITDLDTNPSDGSLMALQMGLYDLNDGFVPETGSLVRVREDGIDSLLTGLLLPSGMHMAPDGDLFIASLAGLIFKMPGNVATSIEDIDPSVPEHFSLYQNYPNPFNPSTTIRYELQKSTQVQLTIFDAQGREITRLADGPQGAGEYEVHWDAAGFASGLYFYSLRTEGRILTRAMMLAK